MEQKSELQLFTDDANWSALRLAATQEVARNNMAAAPSFFLALAELRLGNFQDSLLASARGLEIARNSFWGIVLKYEALCKIEKKEDALVALSRFVEENPSDLQAADMLVDKYAEAGRFDNALHYDALRLAALPKSRDRKAIAIQCFSKPDTLADLLQSVLAQDASDWSVLIWQDGLPGSRHEDRYRADVALVSSVIDDHLPRLRQKFGDVRVVNSAANLGTAPTCKRLIDLAFESNDYVVFFEDDCILSPPALAWFDGVRGLLNQQAWFAAGESPYFNSGADDVPSHMTDLLNTLANAPEVASTYIYEKFVPSTCFATIAEHWRQCSNFRGLPRGDHNISAFMESRGGRTIFPAVPYVRDVGMHHKNGYSVMVLGEDGVKETKNQYVVPQSFEASELRELRLSQGLMFDATSKLDPAALAALSDLLLLPAQPSG